MKRKKRISIKQRLSNIHSWIKAPGFILGLSLFFGIVVALTTFVNPCGRHDHPVNGACYNGEELGSPLMWLIMTFIGAFVLLLLVSSGSANDGKWSNIGAAKEMLSWISRKPKWWKKWYWPAFGVSYVIIALGNYLLNIGAGLPLVYTLGQYLLVVPLVSTLLASFILKQGRDVYHNSKRK
jgi:membrane protease YdiL (CAAX protease family)